MSKYFQRCVFFLSIAVSTLCEAESLPNAISKQLPFGYVVLKYVIADFNQDGKNDYLIVVHRANEEKISAQGVSAPRRPLLVFLQNLNGGFDLLARNDKVVYAVDEGGQCDPFLDDENGVVAKGIFFTVQNSVACGNHWTDYITFKYSSDRHGFVFHKRIYENWVMNDSPNADAFVLGKRIVSSGKKNTPIGLSEYQMKW
jgi:hypothetical protein